MVCECLLQGESGFMCRHMQALCSNVKRLSHLLQKPMSGVWLNSKFIDAFKDFQVIMPSETEISQVSGEMFPGPINMPRKVKARSRPKVKCFKKNDRQFKSKLQERTGNGPMDKRRVCSFIIRIHIIIYIRK